MYKILYIYTKVSGSGEGLVHANPGLRSFRGFQSFQVLWSLRTAQNRPERAQSRSEPVRIAQSAPRAAQSPRAFAQSCSRNRSGSPRAAQSRPERSLRVARVRPELLPLKSRSESHGVCPELLRIAQSCSKNRSGSSVSQALCISDAQFYFTLFSLIRACICTGSR